ncbi:MAG: HAMP domain-containing sensor histidine kinase [Pseudomonadota bacterium]
MSERSRTISGTVYQARQAMRHWLQRRERAFDSGTWRYVVLAWIGCLGMPTYYVIWTYIFPQHYESFSVRLVGMLLCLPALWARTWFKGRFLDAYVFVAITYVLPFQFTYMYLMNYASSVWGQSYLIALIVLFHFPTLWSLAACATGTVFGCLLFAWQGDPSFLLDPEVLEHLPVYAFTIVVVSAAKVGRRMLANEKLAGMAHGLAAVSHELRTPLVSVDANVRGITRRLARGAPTTADCQELIQAVGRIQYEVRHMNHMVDMFLLSATAVSQKLEACEEVSMQEVVDSVMRRYPFAGQAQRDAVQVQIRSDFVFAGKHELSMVILLNLLRNALNALHRAGKGRIRIVVDGKREVPRLLFIDTGCGIAARQLPLIFKRFYSYPPESGSGIGLALCKEIIDAWQASIRCISRELAYTIFVLEFPKIALPQPR